MAKSRSTARARTADVAVFLASGVGMRGGAASFCVVVSLIVVVIADDIRWLTALRATNGDNWPSECQWNVSEAPINWPKLEFNGDHQVRSVNLRGCFVRGTLPEPQPGELSALTVLDLTGNMMSGTIPEELLQLPKLEQLLLSNTNLSGAFPSIPSVTSLGLNLQRIDVSGNRLTSSISSTLWTALLCPSGSSSSSSSLTFYAFRNLLSGPLPTIDVASLVPCQTMRPLLTVDLSHNQLSGIVPEDFFPFTVADSSGSSSPSPSSHVQVDLSWNFLRGTLPDAWPPPPPPLPQQRRLLVTNVVLHVEMNCLRWQHSILMASNPQSVSWWESHAPNLTRQLASSCVARHEDQLQLNQPSLSMSMTVSYSQSYSAALSATRSLPLQFHNDVNGNEVAVDASSVTWSMSGRIGTLSVTVRSETTASSPADSFSHSKPLPSLSISMSTLMSRSFHVATVSIGWSRSAGSWTATIEIPPPTSGTSLDSAVATQQAIGGIAVMVAGATGGSAIAAGIATVNCGTPQPSIADIEHGDSLLTFVIVPFRRFGLIPALVGNILLSLTFFVLNGIVAIAAAKATSAPQSNTNASSCFDIVAQWHLYGSQYSRFPAIAIRLQGVVLPGTILVSFGLLAYDSPGVSRVASSLTAIVGIVYSIAVVCIVQWYVLITSALSHATLTPIHSTGEAADVLLQVRLWRWLVPRGFWEPQSIVYAVGPPLSAANGRSAARILYFGTTLITFTTNALAGLAAGVSSSSACTSLLIVLGVVTVGSALPLMWWSRSVFRLPHEGVLVPLQYVSFAAVCCVKAAKVANIPPALSWLQSGLLLGQVVTGLVVTYAVETPLQSSMGVGDGTQCDVHKPFHVHNESEAEGVSDDDGEARSMNMFVGGFDYDNDTAACSVEESLCFPLPAAAGGSENVPHQQHQHANRRTQRRKGKPRKPESTSRSKSRGDGRQLMSPHVEWSETDIETVALLRLQEFGVGVAGLPRTVLARGHRLRSRTVLQCARVDDDDTVSVVSSDDGDGTMGLLSAAFLNSSSFTEEGDVEQRAPLVGHRDTTGYEWL